MKTLLKDMIIHKRNLRHVNIIKKNIINLNLVECHYSCQECNKNYM